MKTTGYVIAIMLVIGMYAWALALFGNTLASPWGPALASAIVALALWLPLANTWRRVLPGQKTVWQMAAHAFAATGTVLFAIMALNYYGADSTSTHTEKATVVNRYVKERQQTRRIRSRVYSTGKKYNVYYMTLRFDDGRTKEMQITASRYNRVRVGRQLSFPVSRGLLGMPVIKGNKTLSDDDSRRRSRSSDGRKRAHRPTGLHSRRPTAQ